MGLHQRLEDKYIQAFHIPEWQVVGWIIVTRKAKISGQSNSSYLICSGWPKGVPWSAPEGNEMSFLVAAETGSAKSRCQQLCFFLKPLLPPRFQVAFSCTVPAHSLLYLPTRSLSLLDQGCIFMPSFNLYNLKVLYSIHGHIRS